MLFNNLYIIFTMAFFLSTLSVFQPNASCLQCYRMICVIAHVHDNSYFEQLYFGAFEVVLIVFHRTHPILDSSNQSMGEK
jgi:hypothetical protein